MSEAGGARRSARAGLWLHLGIGGSALMPSVFSKNFHPAFPIHGARGATRPTGRCFALSVQARTAQRSFAEEARELARSSSAEARVTSSAMDV